MKRKVIGERLKQLRSLRGISQGRMGRSAGLDKSAVCNIESGIREASFHEMVCFAILLCISLDAFYSTRPDGAWDLAACLLPYTPPPAEEAEVKEGGSGSNVKRKARHVDAEGRRH